MTSMGRLLSCPVLVRRVLSVQHLLSTDYHPPYIVIAGEKGIVNAQIEVRTEGGHSSIPRPHTSIGLLSRIVASIECVCLQLASSEGVSRADACQLLLHRDQNLFPPTLHTASPIYGYLNCINTHGTPSLVPSCMSPFHPHIGFKLS